MPTPLAVVTGASGGIGRDLAELLARDHFDLLLVARSQERLERLTSELSALYNVQCESFPADLARGDERERLARRIAESADVFEVLINNAGVGTHGYFRETSFDDELTIIELNVTALTHLTKVAVPHLLRRARGRIMNVASLASFQPGPLMAVYYASKAYVLSFSEAIAEELEGTGVTVTTLAPGPTTTGFQSAAGLHPSAPSGGTAPMTSMSVAEQGLAGMYAGKRLVVPGFQNRIVVLANRLLPRRMIVRQVRRIQEKRREVTRAARVAGSG